MHTFWRLVDMSPYKKKVNCVRFRGSLGSSTTGLVIGAQWSWGTWGPLEVQETGQTERAG